MGRKTPLSCSLGPRAALLRHDGGVVHANCNATIWQFTATIAHNVIRPIASTISNAQVGLR